VRSGDKVAALGATKEKLINAAELLLAEHGLHNTSVRMIAAAAQVNLSGISFHFQSQENLIKAVLARRLLALAERRRANLAKLLKADPSPGVSALLSAFLDPLFEMSRSSDPGKRAFLKILSQTLIIPSAEYREVLATEVGVYTDEYSVPLAEALPHLTREEIANRMDFALGCIGHAFSDTTRRQPYARANPVEDVKRLTPQLLAFIVAGFQAPPGLAKT
jgi:AcrR family transcriptional regulator